jgi:hypothetical protein
MEQSLNLYRIVLLIGFSSLTVSLRPHDSVSNGTGISTSSPTAWLSAPLPQAAPPTVATDTSQISTITYTIQGAIAPVPTNYVSMSTRGTETLHEASLLTGSCTSTRFAIVTDEFGNHIMYPQIGCSYIDQNCCAFPFDENPYLNECPEGYAATSTWCCPS